MLTAMVVLLLHILPTLKDYASIALTSGNDNTRMVPKPGMFLINS